MATPHKLPQPVTVSDDASLLAQVGVGVLLVDAAGRVLECNERARELLGADLEALLAGPDGPTRLLRHDGTPLERVEWPGAVALRNATTVPGRIIGVPGGAEARWLLVTSQPLRGRRRAVTGSATTLADVTESVLASRGLERQLLRISAHVYRGRFLPDGSYEEIETGVGEAHFLGGEPDLRIPATERWFDAVHPDDRTSLEVMIDRLRSGSGDFAIEYRMVGRDGVTRWARDRLHASHDDDGTITVDGLVVDVTAERAERARLQELAARLRDGEEAAEGDPGVVRGVAPAGVVEQAVGRAGMRVFARETAATGEDTLIWESGDARLLLGLKGSDPLTPLDWSEHVIDDDRAEYRRAVADQRAGVGGAAEYGVRSAGTIRWLRETWVASLHDDGGAVAFVLAHDVTAARAATEELRRSEERLRAVTETAPIALTVLGPDLSLERANVSARELWGGAIGEERIGRIHADDAVDVGPALAAALATGADLDRSFRIHRADGGMRWVHSRVRTIRDASGDRVATILVDDDVTEVHRTRQGLLDALGEAEEARREAEVLSRIDLLTALPNRRAAIERLEAGALALILIDADHFKRVNDIFGHGAGDAVLRALASRIAEAVPDEALVARWGGEEFAIVLPEVADDAALRALGEVVRAAVAVAPIRVPGAEVELTVSLGGAHASERHDHDRLIERADLALYAAKRRGRDRVCLDDDLRSSDRDDAPEGFHVARLLVEAASAREGVSADHPDDVAELAAAVARRLGLGSSRVERCRLAGLLHDVGKVAVSDRILAKPGPLAPAELREVRTHAAIGADLAAGLPLLAEVAPAIRHHHERWDGTGYPTGLAGDQIPIEARIVAAADAWSAMHQHRPYAAARDDADARQELLAVAGSQLDPDIVQVLLDVLDSRDLRR